LAEDGIVYINTYGMKATPEYGRDALFNMINNAPQEEGIISYDVSLGVPCSVVKTLADEVAPDDGSRVEVTFQRKGGRRVPGIKDTKIYGGVKGGNVHINLTKEERGVELGNKVLRLVLGEGGVIGGLEIGPDVRLVAVKIYLWREGHDLRTIWGPLSALMKGDWDVRGFRDVAKVRDIAIHALTSFLQGMPSRCKEEEYVRLEFCLEGRGLGENVNLDVMVPALNFNCGGEEGCEGAFKQVLTLLGLVVHVGTMKEKMNEVQILLVRLEDILGGNEKALEWGSAQSAELEQVMGKVRKGRRAKRAAGRMCGVVVLLFRFICLTLSIVSFDSFLSIVLLIILLTRKDGCGRR
jgi:hypothetical protein